MKSICSFLQIFDVAQKAQSTPSIPELMQQLTVTQAELENVKVSRHIDFSVVTVLFITF